MVQSIVQCSAVSELRALLMIAKKEWFIFLRYPSWIIASLIWPVLFPVGYIFMAKALSGPEGTSLTDFQALTGTTDYRSFIIIGSILWMWMNATLWNSGMQLREEQMRGTLESNWLCPIWRGSLLVGGSLVKVLLSMATLVISVIELRIIYGIQLVGSNPGLLIFILFLAMMIVYGIGMAFASLVLRFKEANALVFLVRGIFMIFCGVSFPIEVLPDWMRSVAMWLPLTYAIRDMRLVLLTDVTLSQLLPDLLILTGFAIFLPLLGYGMFVLAERTARRTGELARY